MKSEECKHRQRCEIHSHASPLGWECMRLEPRMQPPSAFSKEKQLS